MKKEYLELWIHDNKELQAIVNKRIVSREKLHHWPLSYVEKIILEDNTVLIYKSQSLAASVEHEFYKNVKAPFIIFPLWADIYKGCSIMLLPYIHRFENNKDIISDKKLDKKISLIELFNNPVGC